MIKKSITLMVCALVFMLVMYRCKNKEADPLTPDQGLVDEINRIAIDNVPLEEGAPVATTDSKIESAPRFTTLTAEITSITTSGVEPADVKAQAVEVRSFFTKDELTVLANVGGNVVETAAEGGKLPADLASIMAKAAANPALIAYLPKITFPTVAGSEIRGTRTNAGEMPSSENFEGTQNKDACLAIAEAECDKVKGKLGASRNQQLAAAEEKYKNAKTGLQNSQTSCSSASTAKYAALVKDAEATAARINAVLTANAALLANDYLALRALVSFQLISYVTLLNELKKADLQCCVTKTTAGLTNAENAYNKNRDGIENAYSRALEKADKAKADLIRSCHNQGGGR
ncbi:hypothetical protein SAMN05216327_109217 [Dyadobacter sp. SG02]|uniref:hypothetical protein n=1 Tax=Dyadobacter sp. SG02 TaxID=1855291 RepID=UPI0008C848A5|nr:hypothetical protein [Dyadobacter sp. SG02]SEJ39319.1 hypothetical protein SAMN05216327_109217 [Dyadobacter sp. SG02]